MMFVTDLIREQKRKKKTNSVQSQYFKLETEQMQTPQKLTCEFMPSGRVKRSYLTCGTSRVAHVIYNLVLSHIRGKEDVKTDCEYHKWNIFVVIGETNIIL